MKIKELARVMMIGATMMAIAACSPKNHGRYGSSGMGDADGAQASGIGEDANFGGADGMGGRSHAAGKDTYYFDYDSNTVHENDKASISAKADALVRNPNKKLVVEGHTDPRGSREYNVALGERRGNAVLDLMRSKGVGGNQARVVSYGAERPASSGRTEQDFQLDRRATIKVD